MSIAIYTKYINCYNVSMGLSEWIRQKYIEWLTDEGVIRSQREFADYIGIEKVALSRYINKNIKNPDIETVDKIANKLGPEIYDVLGLARPDVQLKKLTSIWHTLSEEQIEQIFAIAFPDEDI